MNFFDECPSSAWPSGVWTTNASRLIIYLGPFLEYQQLRPLGVKHRDNVYCQQRFAHLHLKRCARGSSVKQMNYS